MPVSEPRLTGPPEPGPRLTDAAGPEPALIRGYLDTMAARLPASIADELADGLTETYRSCLSRGLAPEAAATAAVAEFGAPEEIAAGFAEVNPARRAARRLLRIGPAVGTCWMAALATSHVGRSWTGWIVSAPAWAVASVVLAGLIGLLAVAALGRRYRLATATGVAGCFGYAALDLALIIAAPIALAPVGWVTAVAMAASSARIALTIRLLRPALARLYPKFHDHVIVCIKSHTCPADGPPLSSSWAISSPRRGVLAHDDQGPAVRAGRRLAGVSRRRSPGWCRCKCICRAGGRCHP